MTVDDIDAVFELEKICFDPHWPRSDYVNVMKDPHAMYMVGLLKGRLIAFLGVKIDDDGRNAYLPRIAVHPEFQRRGLATVMLGVLLGSFAKQQATNKIESIALHVRPSNVAALALYKKLGFEIIGKARNVYLSGERDALVMAKFLIDKIIARNAVAYANAQIAEADDFDESNDVEMSDDADDIEDVAPDETVRG